MQTPVWQFPCWFFFQNSFFPGLHSICKMLFVANRIFKLLLVWRRKISSRMCMLSVAILGIEWEMWRVLCQAVWHSQPNEKRNLTQSTWLHLMSEFKELSKLFAQLLHSSTTYHCSFSNQSFQQDSAEISVTISSRYWQLFGQPIKRNVPNIRE